MSSESADLVGDSNVLTAASTESANIRITASFESGFGPGYRNLPASTSGLIALLEVHEKNEMINDRYVAILTGKY